MRYGGEKIQKTDKNTENEEIKISMFTKGINLYAENLNFFVKTTYIKIHLGFVLRIKKNPRCILIKHIKAAFWEGHKIRSIEKTEKWCVHYVNIQILFSIYIDKSIKSM